ncbi:MAG: hypothetical protein PHI35_03260, partial [Victivallaceae bacterium]|nr:hypothetical protein [Victivallaceae bacterium]
MEFIDFMVSLARDAGREAVSYFEDDKHFDVDAKSTPRDLVSTADKAVERLITTRILAQYPDHGIFGEEYGKSGDATRFCWIIDPIDGRSEEHT